MSQAYGGNTQYGANTFKAQNRPIMASNRPHDLVRFSSSPVGYYHAPMQSLSSFDNMVCIKEIVIPLHSNIFVYTLLKVIINDLINSYNHLNFDIVVKLDIITFKYTLISNSSLLTEIITYFMHRVSRTIIILTYTN